MMETTSDQNSELDLESFIIGLFSKLETSIFLYISPKESTQKILKNAFNFPEKSLNSFIQFSPLFVLYSSQFFHCRSLLNLLEKLIETDYVPKWKFKNTNSLILGTKGSSDIETWLIDKILYMKNYNRKVTNNIEQNLVADPQLIFVNIFKNLK